MTAAFLSGGHCRGTATEKMNGGQQMVRMLFILVRWQAKIEYTTSRDFMQVGSPDTTRCSRGNFPWGIVADR